MKQRSPYFHIYMGLVVILASFAAGVTWQSVVKAKKKRHVVIHCQIMSSQKALNRSSGGENPLKQFTPGRDGRAPSALKPIPLAEAGVHDAQFHFCQGNRRFTCKPSQE
jgi:hypothetical protein